MGGLVIKTHSLAPNTSPVGLNQRVKFKFDFNEYLEGVVTHISPAKKLLTVKLDGLNNIKAKIKYKELIND